MTTVMMSGYQVAQASRGDKILPARKGDGNEWFWGECGLRCRQWQQVTPIGDVCVPGLRVMLNGCSDCLADLVAWCWNRHMGESHVTVLPYNTTTRPTLPAALDEPAVPVSSTLSPPPVELTAGALLRRHARRSWWPWKRP